MTPKKLPNDTRLTAQSFQKSLKKQSTQKERKHIKNKPKMNPKGLPEFPGKSKKSASRRPGTSQEPPGTPKGPPRHTTAAKRTSKEPKSHPKDRQMTPKGIQGAPLGSTKASKCRPKRHLKRIKTQNGKTMQTSSRQRLHRRNSQTRLRRQ